MWRIVMHHECAVSQCGRPTQDRICQSHVDELITAIRSIVSNPNPDANPTRLVLVANTGDEKRGEEAPTAGPKKTVELATDHGGLWEDLDVTLTKQHRLPKQARGASADGSPALFVEAASDAKRELESFVWYWVYQFANTNSHLTFDPFTATVPEACAWVAQFPGLIASLNDAETMHADFLRVTRKAARVVDITPDKHLLGLCDSTVAGSPCEAPLWLSGDRLSVTCWECETEHDVDVLQEKLIVRVRAHIGSATEVAAQLAHFVGLEVKVNSIRTWARKGELQAIPPAVTPSTHDKDGNELAPPPPVYRVEDVFRLSQSKKTRNRERRAA